MKKDWFLGMFFSLCALPASQHLYSQEYFSRLSMEGVDLIGSITYGKIDEFTAVTPGFYLFDAEDYYRPVTAQTLLSGYMGGGSAYNDGKIYCNEFDDTWQVQSAKPMWRIYDATTFELLSEIELKDNCESTTRSMAYDPVSGKIYGFNYTYTETYFVEIEPRTGQMTRIGDKMNPEYRFLCISCNRRGQLYCVYIKEDPQSGSQYQYLAKIQKTTGKIAVVGEIQANNLLPEDLLINMKYKQAMFFDNSKNKLYWMFGSSSRALGSEYTAIAELNTVNAQATLVAYINKSYHISSAFFKEPKMGAPSIISGFEYVPEAAGALRGLLKFTLPTTAYNGLPLDDEKLTIVVKENGRELVREEALPGSAFVSKSLAFSNDLHTVDISVSNAEGEGPVIRRSFYVGYDVPDACQNIRLTGEGLTTTLTWDAPKEGQNGAVINPENYAYKIIRWPGEVTVAERRSERVFTETHPGEMTRYVYAVVPLDGDREGKRAFSNNLIVGTPLDTPYGGPFANVADMYNYYTILDVNGDNSTWCYDENSASAYYDYSYYNPADDWLISPPVNYKEGKEYVLKFKAFSSLYSYLEAMEVKFGDARTPESQNLLLLDIPAVPTLDEEENTAVQYEVPFTVSQDGVYYYSFHAYSEPYHEYLFLFDISVEEKGNGSVALGKEKAGQPIAVRAGKGSIHVKNPLGLPVSVYAVNGGLVAKTCDCVFELPVVPGIYVVGTERQMRKVAVF